MIFPVEVVVIVIIRIITTIVITIMIIITGNIIVIIVYFQSKELVYVSITFRIIFVHAFLSLRQLGSLRRPAYPWNEEAPVGNDEDKRNTKAKPGRQSKNQLRVHTYGSYLPASFKGWLTHAPVFRTGNIYSFYG